MKKILFTSIVLFVSFITFSFDTTIDYELNKAFFANRNGINYFKGKPINGTVEMHFSNGKIKSRKRYLNGIANGIFEDYYSNGQIEDKSGYKNGRKHGVFEHYFPNGFMSSKQSYKDGLGEGLFENFGSKKATTRYTMKSGKIIGTKVSYDEIGNLILKEIFNDDFIYHERYLDGVHLLEKGKYIREDKVDYNLDASYLKKEGKWEYYFGLVSPFISEEDQPELFKINRENKGKISYVENFKNGKKDGLQIFYYPNGNVQSKETIFYDLDTDSEKNIGIEELFYENGKIQERTTYDKSGEQIKHEKFTESGKLIIPE